MEDHNDELPAELSAEVRTKPESQANPKVIVTDEAGNQEEETDRLLYMGGNPTTYENGEKKKPPPLPRR